MKSKTCTRSIVLAFFATLAMPFVSSAQEQQPTQSNGQQFQRYTVTDLGTLGGTFSLATSINNNGSVVGLATLAGDTALHAFLWRKGTMTDLSTLAPMDSLPFSQANSINDSDEIVGFSETSTPDPLGENFCGGSLVCLPVIWRNGVIATLPTLGGTNGQATGINNRGEVTGFAENSTPDPTCVPPQVLHYEPVIWYKGEVQELPTFPGDPDGQALGINDSGQAIGTSLDCQFVPGHALLWQKRMLTNLGTLGGLPLFPVGIDNKGQVVGENFIPGGPNVQSFLWQDGVVSGLGTLPGDVGSGANGINNKGQVAGQSCIDQNGDCRAFLWQDGVMTDLNTLVPADSPLYLYDTAPAGINSRGEIVGLGVQNSTGELRAFLLTPSNGDFADESASLAAQGRTGERRTVVLPERIRVLRQGLGFGRLLGPAIRPSTN
jgi:probable HAF family extracellular repeat protein